MNFSHIDFLNTFFQFKLFLFILVNSFFLQVLFSLNFVDLTLMVEKLFIVEMTIFKVTYDHFFIKMGNLTFISNVRTC